MLIANATILDSLRLTRIIQDQATRFQSTLPLRFIDRLVQTPADDDEIIANITARNHVADLVPDDQAAAVYDNLKLEFVTNVIPNIKDGTRLSQSLMLRLTRMAKNLATTQDADYFTNWEMATTRMLLRNVKERTNQLACAMMLDSLSYNKNGVVITGNWGMPSDLKITPAVLWTSPTTATPVTDLQSAIAYAANTYGETYNRVTISTADLINAYATAEFKAQVASVTEIRSPLAAAAFGGRDPRNKAFFQELLGVEIETEDKLMNTPNPDGTLTSTRVLPLGKVLLSNSNDDKDPSAMDFANGVVAEAIAAELSGAPANFPSGELYGPIAYYVGSPTLNPPNLSAWAVQRGFPRKFRKTATAVLTVQ